MTYSKDYRQMILSKLNSGKTYRQLSTEYNISTTTILNWKKKATNQNDIKTRNKTATKFVAK